MSQTQTADAPARDTGAGAPASIHQYASGYGYSTAAASGNQSGESTRGARPRRHWPVILAGLALPILLFGGWFAVSGLGLVPAYRLPAPDSVWLAATQGLADGSLGIHVAISTQRVLIGFVAGALIGLALGAVVGLSKWGSAFLSPSIGAFRAVPSLAWVPLLVLYVGINEDSKVTLIAIGALFPVYTTVAGALRHVDPHLVELGRAYGLGRLQLLREVQLPAVVPSIVSGLRLALAQAWLFLVAAELIASSMGLGFLLIDSQNNGRVDRMFLTIILLGILGKTTDALIGLLEKYLLKRWG